MKTNYSRRSFFTLADRLWPLSGWLVASRHWLPSQKDRLYERRGGLLRQTGRGEDYQCSRHLHDVYSGSNATLGTAGSRQGGLASGAPERSAGSRRILHSDKLHCEAALVSGGSGICTDAGNSWSCVTVANQNAGSHIPQSIPQGMNDLKNEVIMQKGHRYGYDHALSNCGVRIVEVETMDQYPRPSIQKQFWRTFSMQP